MRISGDSLSGDGIHDGYVVIVDKSVTDIIDGKIYILNLNNNGCVVKHATKSKDHLILTSSNTNYGETLASDVEVLGQVILSGRRRKH